MSFINITLLIQAFHFFIAFLIIKHFFFKQAFGHIQVEDALQESLITTVQDHQLAVAQKEQELVAHWQAARHYFGQNVPSLKQEQFFAKTPPVVVPKLDTNAVQDAARSCAQELIKKVDHVR